MPVARSIDARQRVSGPSHLPRSRAATARASLAHAPDGTNANLQSGAQSRGLQHVVHGRVGVNLLVVVHISGVLARIEPEWPRSGSRRGKSVALWEKVG
jgi:hypothetical protein